MGKSTRVWIADAPCGWVATDKTALLLTAVQWFRRIVNRLGLNNRRTHDARATSGGIFVCLAPVSPSRTLCPAASLCSRTRGRKRPIAAQRHCLRAQNGLTLSPRQ